MGILNLTPDSFHEPSRYNMSILESGADIIDIGAVSTRPGADPVSEEEEWNRLYPVLAALDPGISFSIDTTRSSIVRKALDLTGRKFIVNDVSAGRDDPDMLDTVAQLGLSYIAMHSRGNPKTMDSLAEYGDVVEEVMQFFRDFMFLAARKGISDWILDPGFGFAKDEGQNLRLLHNLERFKEFGRPVLVGIADKRFTRGRTEELHREAIRRGADILRVHDVDAIRRTLKAAGRSCLFRKSGVSF